VFIPLRLSGCRANSLKCEASGQSATDDGWDFENIRGEDTRRVRSRNSGSCIPTPKNGIPPDDTMPRLLEAESLKAAP
jgi:hypothetical protein